MRIFPDRQQHLHQSQVEEIKSSTHMGVSDFLTSFAASKKLLAHSSQEGQNSIFFYHFFNCSRCCKINKSENSSKYISVAWSYLQSTFRQQPWLKKCQLRIYYSQARGSSLSSRFVMMISNWLFRNSVIPNWLLQQLKFQLV